MLKERVVEYSKKEKFMNDFMTTQELADYLKVKKQTLEVWRSKNINGIPYIKVGASVRYRKTDVEKWIQRQTNNPFYEESETDENARKRITVAEM